MKKKVSEEQNSKEVFHSQRH